jgi:SAM-dependent methyltransferase
MAARIARDAGKDARIKLARCDVSRLLVRYLQQMNKAEAAVEAPAHAESRGVSPPAGKWLNMGGGDEQLPGWSNVDLHSRQPDLRIDLFKLPWPLEPGSVDGIAMFHFLEHVPDLEATVIEVNRVLKPGGLFWVRVPHARHPAAYDISHRQFFTCSTFHTIAANAYYRFGGRQLFRTESFRMRVLNAPWLKWSPLDWFASRFPVAYEKFCWIAPAEIEWRGRKV